MGRERGDLKAGKLEITGTAAETSVAQDQLAIRIHVHIHVHIYAHVHIHIKVGEKRKWTLEKKNDFWKNYWLKCSKHA